MKINSSKWLKRATWLSLGALSLLAIKKSYTEWTGDFRISNIRYEETAFRPKETMTSLSDDELNHLKLILNQPYSFLGKGNQSYAFESEDGKYVLKFFKFGHLKQNPLLNFLPKIPLLTNYLTKKNKAQEKRFVKVFDGYQIAYHIDPENTAVLFIHLNKTTNLNQFVNVKDKLGFSHTIDLDQVVFVVQEKVIPTKQVLTTLLDKGDIEGAKTRVNQLFDLYLSEYKKGIYDRDHNLIYNTGFKENRAIRLDVGKLRRDESVKNLEFYKKDLEKIAYQRIERFIKTYYPKYQNEMASAIERKLDLIFNHENSNEQ